MEKDFINKYKILLIGDSNVGKSSLLIRFSDGKYFDNFMPTIGVDFRTKKMNINDEIINLEIWDTAGQDRFRALTKLYYRNCYGALLVFDITNKKSFINIKNWIYDFDKHCNIPDVSKILIGNKCDLDNEKQVSAEEINNLCSIYNLKYIETSAKDNTNIQLSFKELTSQIKNNYKNIDNYNKNKNNNIKLENNYNKNFCTNNKC